MLLFIINILTLYADYHISYTIASDVILLYLIAFCYDTWVRSSYYPELFFERGVCSQPYSKTALTLYCMQ